MKNTLLLALISVFLFTGFKYDVPGNQQVQHPYADSVHQRLASAVIYEVNIRQITQEGTIKAFTEQHLDRLKKLGVDVLWLMPIYPVSIKNRKGTLGSYYSIADYRAVNPEFGTLGDLRELVQEAHERNMYVILDWVANHTGWDHQWISEHPEWYTHDEKGNIVPPVPDWSDVADLNYDNLQMQAEMMDAMDFWIREANVDGYRCDAAAMAPVDFWYKALQHIDSLKPVIKLAEAWEPELMAKGFDAAYGWEFHHIINGIAQGKSKLTDIENYTKKSDTLYAPDDMLLHFITNHDENSWAGTEYERMGNYVQGFAAVTYLMPGIPLIYTGQEAKLQNRLQFFEKDLVPFTDTSLYSFYRNLNALKHRNQALRAGINAGDLRIQVDTVNQFMVILRTFGNDKVLGIFNFSDQEMNQSVTIPEAFEKYANVFTGKKYKVSKNKTVPLKPWEFLVLEKR